MFNTLLRNIGLRPRASQNIAELRISDEATVQATVALASPSKPVISPITKRNCAFYLLVIEEWVNGQKHPFLTETSNKHFLLKDDGNAVMANGKNASSRIKRNREQGHNSDYPAEIRAVIRRHGFSMIDEYGEGRSLSFTETLILPGDSVLVSGRVTSEVDPGGAASYREQPQRLVFLVDRLF